MPTSTGGRLPQVPGAGRKKPRPPVVRVIVGRFSGRSGARDAFLCSGTVRRLAQPKRSLIHMRYYGHPAANASWKHRKSKMSHTPTPVEVSQSQTNDSPVMNLSWKHRKSKMSSVPVPVERSQSA